MNAYIFFYLLSISMMTFFLFGIDKRKAEKHQHRISEFTLLLMSLLGGSVGAILGMLIFNHKISKLSFCLKVLVIILIQITVMLIYFKFPAFKIS